jgi:hypothetical protein
MPTPIVERACHDVRHPGREQGFDERLAEAVAAEGQLG